MSFKACLLFCVKPKRADKRTGDDRRDTTAVASTPVLSRKLTPVSEIVDTVSKADLSFEIEAGRSSYEDCQEHAAWEHDVLQLEDSIRAPDPQLTEELGFLRDRLAQLEAENRRAFILNEKDKAHIKTLEAKCEALLMHLEELNKDDDAQALPTAPMTQLLRQQQQQRHQQHPQIPQQQEQQVQQVSAGMEDGVMTEVSLLHQEVQQAAGLHMQRDTQGQQPAEIKSLSDSKPSNRSGEQPDALRPVTTFPTLKTSPFSANAGRLNAVQAQEQGQQQQEEKEQQQEHQEEKQVQLEQHLQEQQHRENQEERQMQLEQQLQATEATELVPAARVLSVSHQSSKSSVNFWLGHDIGQQGGPLPTPPAVADCTDAAATGVKTTDATAAEAAAAAGQPAAALKNKLCDIYDDEEASTDTSIGAFKERASTGPAKLLNTGRKGNLVGACSDAFELFENGLYVSETPSFNGDNKPAVFAVASGSSGVGGLQRPSQQMVMHWREQLQFQEDKSSGEYVSSSAWEVQSPGSDGYKRFAEAPIFAGLTSPSANFSSAPANLRPPQMSPLRAESVDPQASSASVPTPETENAQTTLWKSVHGGLLSVAAWSKSLLGSRAWVEVQEKRKTKKKVPLEAVHSNEASTIVDGYFRDDVVKRRKRTVLSAWVVDALMPKSFCKSPPLKTAPPAKPDLWAKARIPVSRLKTMGRGHADTMLRHPSEELRHATPNRATSFKALSKQAMAAFQICQAAYARISVPMESWLTLRYQRLTSSVDVRVRAAIIVSISLINISIGALLYKLVTGSDWASAFFTIYAILFNVPGTDVTAERTLLATLLVNIIFITGILVFAVMLGMVAEEILQQLAVAGKRRRHPFHGRAIVLLAESDKEVLNQHVAGVLDMGVEVHTRTGKPYSVKDLQMVSAADAAYVVLLYPGMQGGVQSPRDQAIAEALKAATVAAMSTLGRATKQHLVVQVPNEIPREYQQLETVQGLLAAEGTAVQVLRISETKVVDRLVAQTALQPGIVTVLRGVLRQGKQYSFMYIPVPDNGMCTYRELRRRYTDCAVIGYVSASNATKRTWLNPEDSDQLGPGDKLVALARSPLLDELRPQEEDLLMTRLGKKAIHRVAQMSTEEVNGRRLLVVGWPAETLWELVEGLRAFAAPGTHVTLMVDSAAPDVPQITAGRSVSLEFIKTEITMSAENFLLGGIDRCDTVIVGVPSELQYPDNDVLVLSALLQIQKVASEVKHKVHVVVKATDINTKRVASNFLNSLTNCYITVEIILPNEITSAILTQVLWCPYIIDLVVELMVDGEGNELYILDIDQLGFSVGESTAFGEVVEAGKLLQMSVLGYSRQGGLRQVLAPPAEERVEFQQGDKIVVVADLVGNVS